MRERTEREALAILTGAVAAGVEQKNWPTVHDTLSRLEAELSAEAPAGEPDPWKRALKESLGLRR